MRYCHFGVSPVNYSDSDSDSQLTVTGGLEPGTSLPKVLGFTTAPVGFLFAGCKAVMFSVSQVKSSKIYLRSV